MKSPRCPICNGPLDPWCIERHVAEAKAELAEKEESCERLRAEIDAYEKAGMERTGQA